MLIAVLAPELVAFTAWTQHREAAKIVKIWRQTFEEKQPQNAPWFRKLMVSMGFTKRHGAELGSSRSIESIENVTSEEHTDQTPDPPHMHAVPSSHSTVHPEKIHQDNPVETDTVASPSPVRHVWTMVHGHYVAMGGLHCPQPPYKSPSLKDLANPTLTSLGFKTLCEHHPELIPDISEDQIRDKSKANGLTKTLVCLQAAWFCAQCISRLAQHMPVTLLELNAFGHSICALIIYGLWWHKPYDVETTTCLEGENAKYFTAAVPLDLAGEHLLSRAL